MTELTPQARDRARQGLRDQRIETPSWGYGTVSYTHLTLPTTPYV